MITACESELAVEALEDVESVAPVEQLNRISQDDDLSFEDRRKLEPGRISPPVFTGKLRNQLKDLGKDPDLLENKGLSEDGIWLVGKDAWDRFFKDREIDSLRVDEIASPSAFFNPEVPFREQTIIMSGDPTPAYTEMTIVDLSNPPANGSITVQYEGEQVTTNYSTGMNAMQVAFALSSDINNHSAIQLTAVVPSSGTVRVTEKRDGCDHNGNTVHVSHTNGTHISVNNSQFSMSGGTDDGTGCSLPDAPDAPTLTSPANGTTNQPTSLTLQWNSSEGATSYGLQVATDGSFSNLIVNETGITTTSGNLSGLSYSTTYYWRVNASNSGGTSGWSDSRNFTTSDPPLFLSWNSFVDTPCCTDSGPVDMGSYSWASEPIAYIDVIGTSFRDFSIIAQLFDGGQQRSFAGVGITEFKSSFEPESNWWQIGDHGFSDPDIQPSGSINTSSSDSVNF